MEFRRAVYLFCFLLILLHAALAASDSVTPTHYRPPFNRSSFPSTFVFGAASAAFQVEGAASEGGRGPSIWDTFVRQHPEKIWDRNTGDVAIDFYHRYKEDIHMLKNVGLDAYRLSLSWSRILPKGTIAGGVNQEGVNFYNNVINELLLQGMKPFVTLFHWDLPQALEDVHGGFLSPTIVNPFRDYADICYKLFGDRVKHWITLNEPFSYSQFGYATGTFAPGRCSNYVGKCEKGNSGTEPYIVAHNLLLAHAAAAQVYKQKYQKHQKGEVGITLASHWFEPLDDSVAAFKSSRRMLDFYVGWYLHPIVYGDYPPSMRAYVGKRLPTFTKAQSMLLKQSMDFLGMNYYTSRYTAQDLSYNRVNLSYTTDPHALLLTERKGIPIGEPTALDWLFICPEGIRSLMLYLKDKYKNPPVYITENGMADKNIETLPLEKALEDNARIKYFEGHYWYLLKAIKEGANVKGHFCWTFLDDFEWDAGLTVRFGIAYVDYKNGLKRHYKKSAYWLQNFLLKVIH